MTSRWDAVFLDRDGTINVGAPSGEYLADIDAVALLPGAADAVARLNQAGVVVLVVTNQRGVALGLMTEAAVAAVNRRLADLLAERGARLDGVYVCPHDEGACDCRKPRDGMLRRAFADRPGLDPHRCAIVGDSDRDTAAGTPLGLTRIRLAPAGRADPHADHTVPDLARAVDWLLSTDAREGKRR